ncbi:btk-binding protein-related [Anaeramoeba ignava]|uniref:Btk-binding protein-related n=1 Tax=Anaeramoeba ignava TaxID=1746090 RepID=A0A9Q0LI39_ANAIG|nr:btk-binding protein-related [Anaeramoeba ignava]
MDPRFDLFQIWQKNKDDFSNFFEELTDLNSLLEELSDAEFTKICKQGFWQKFVQTLKELTKIKGYASYYWINSLSGIFMTMFAHENESTVELANYFQESDGPKLFIQSINTKGNKEEFMDILNVFGYLSEIGTTQNSIVKLGILDKIVEIFSNEKNEDFRLNYTISLILCSLSVNYKVIPQIVANKKLIDILISKLQHLLFQEIQVFIIEFLSNLVSDPDSQDYIIDHLPIPLCLANYQFPSPTSQKHQFNLIHQFILHKPQEIINLDCVKRLSEMANDFDIPEETFFAVAIELFKNPHFGSIEKNKITQDFIKQTIRLIHLLSVDRHQFQRSISSWALTELSLVPNVVFSNSQIFDPKNLTVIKKINSCFPESNFLLQLSRLSSQKINPEKCTLYGEQALQFFSVNQVMDFIYSIDEKEKTEILEKDQILQILTEKNVKKEEQKNQSKEFLWKRIKKGSIFVGICKQENFQPYPMILALDNCEELNFDGVLFWPSLNYSRVLCYGSFNPDKNEVVIVEYQMIQGAYIVVPNIYQGEIGIGDGNTISIKGYYHSSQESDIFELVLQNDTTNNNSNISSLQSSQPDLIEKEIIEKPSPLKFQQDWAENLSSTTLKKLPFMKDPQHIIKPKLHQTYFESKSSSKFRKSSSFIFDCPFTQSLSSATIITNLLSSNPAFLTQEALLLFLKRIILRMKNNVSHLQIGLIKNIYHLSLIDPKTEYSRLCKEILFFISSSSLFPSHVRKYAEKRTRKLQSTPYFRLSLSLDSQKFSDFIISSVDGSLIYTHRFILASYSPFFKHYFQDNPNATKLEFPTTKDILNLLFHTLYSRVPKKFPLEAKETIQELISKFLLPLEIIPPNILRFSSEAEKMEINSALYPTYTLIVDGTTIPTHESILYFGSDYFQGMMTFHDLSGQSSPKLEIKAQSLEMIQFVLHFLYGHDPLTSLSLEKALELLAVSNEIMLDLLRIRLESYLCDFVDFENVNDIFSFSQYHQAHFLAAFCRNFLD